MSVWRKQLEGGIWRNPSPSPSYSLNNENEVRFPLGEASGLISDDQGSLTASSSNGTLTYQQGASFSSDPALESIRFGADNAYFVMPIDSLLNHDVAEADFYFNGWFYLEASWDPSDDGINILNTRPTNDIGVSVGITAGGSPSPFMTIEQGGVVDFKVFAGISKEQWHMLTFTYDASAHTCKLYVDGVFFAEDTALGGALDPLLLDSPLNPQIGVSDVFDPNTGTALMSELLICMNADTLPDATAIADLYSKYTS